VNTLAAMNLLQLPRHTIFVCDTYINPDPTAEQIAEMARLAAAAVRRFGVTPRIALLSHSSFGSDEAPSAEKMRAALRLIEGLEPDLEVEGEMHADAALSKPLPGPGVPGIAAHGGGEPADHADARRRQHHLQRAEDRGGRGGQRRADPAGGGAPRPRPDPDQHRPAHRQHDRALRRRR
jgi:hypothetical protein